MDKDSHQCIRKRQTKDRNTKSFSGLSMKSLLQEADCFEFWDIVKWNSIVDILITILALKKAKT